MHDGIGVDSLNFAKTPRSSQNGFSRTVRAGHNVERWHDPGRQRLDQALPRVPGATIRSPSLVRAMWAM